MNCIGLIRKWANSSLGGVLGLKWYIFNEILLANSISLRKCHLAPISSFPFLSSISWFIKFFINNHQSTKMLLSLPSGTWLNVVPKDLGILAQSEHNTFFNEIKKSILHQYLLQILFTGHLYLTFSFLTSASFLLSETPHIFFSYITNYNRL